MIFLRSALTLPNFLRHDEPPIIPQDMHPPVDLAESLEQFRELLARYLNPDEIALVENAYAFAEAAHRGQMRLSGEPYLSHPLAVAATLATWRLDAQALIAALLHDVMEDTAITKLQIVRAFGKPAAELVDGVSKLDRIENQTWEEAQAENMRKMLMAMVRDVRVIIIKLADRLHNMRTLGSLRLEKRRRVARETMDIYAPIANRLGFNALYRELQELAFSHLQPMRYRVLAKALRASRGNRREVVSKIRNALEKELKTQQINAQISGREKHIYGIYRKMRDKHLSFSQVFDIYGFRVVVANKPECYLTLGALHSLYKPLPGKFKDYIAIPKANRYQALHSTLIGPYGAPIEIQIRTTAMDLVAESGVASHWLYKDKHALDELKHSTHKWLQSLIELQSTSISSAEFLEHVKVDLFPGEVYVFTPRGKILALPRGATAVDFAYAVHTDIGNHCVACRINFEPMPLRSELRNGDRVEIITAKHATPNVAWLAYVRTSKARSQIRHFFKTQNAAQSATLGEHLLAKALRNVGMDIRSIASDAWSNLAQAFGVKSRGEMLTDIGLGKRVAESVARRLARNDSTIAKKARAQHGANTEIAGHQDSDGIIFIQGTEGAAVELATCCRPIPGDPIIALLRKGRGLAVHTHDCQNIAHANREHNTWVEVDWAPNIQGTFAVVIRVVVANRPGMLARIASAIADEASNILDVHMDADHDTTTALYFNLQVHNRIHLSRILRSMRRIPEVARITRIQQKALRFGLRQ